MAALAFFLSALSVFSVVLAPAASARQAEVSSVVTVLKQAKQLARNNRLQLLSVDGREVPLDVSRLQQMVESSHSTFYVVQKDSDQLGRRWAVGVHRQWSAALQSVSLILDVRQWTDVTQIAQGKVVDFRSVEFEAGKPVDPGKLQRAIDSLTASVNKKLAATAPTGLKGRAFQKMHELFLGTAHAELRSVIFGAIVLGLLANAALTQMLALHLFKAAARTQSAWSRAGLYTVATLCSALTGVLAGLGGVVLHQATHPGPKPIGGDEQYFRLLCLRRT